MKKESGFFGRKSVAGFELGMIVLSVFAFAFMIGNVEITSAIETSHHAMEGAPPPPSNVPATASVGKSDYLAKLVGVKEEGTGWLAPGGGTHALANGLQWAAMAYMAGQLIGGLFGKL